MCSAPWYRRSGGWRASGRWRHVAEEEAEAQHALRDEGRRRCCRGTGRRWRGRPPGDREDGHEDREGDHRGDGERPVAGRLALLLAASTATDHLRALEAEGHGLDQGEGAPHDGDRFRLLGPGRHVLVGGGDAAVRSAGDRPAVRPRDIITPSTTAWPPMGVDGIEAVGRGAAVGSGRASSAASGTVTLSAGGRWRLTVGVTPT